MIEALNARFGRETARFPLSWNLRAYACDSGIAISHASNVSSIQVKSKMSAELSTDAWSKVKQYSPNEQRHVRGTGRAYRVIMLGNTNAGKTTLVGTLTGERVVERQPTLSVDLKIVYHKNHQFQCWDTAGQERFQSIVRSYYRDLSVAICVFDVGDRASFEAVDRWLQQLREYSNVDAETLSLVLVGNKIDLESRVVTHTEALRCAKARSMNYFETCAHSVDDVNKMFGQTFSHVIQTSTAKRASTPAPPPTTVSLATPRRTPCCL